MADKPYEVSLERMQNVAGDLMATYFIRSLRNIRALTPDMTGLPDDIEVGAVVSPEGIDHLIKKRSSSVEVSMFVAGDYRPPR